MKTPPPLSRRARAPLLAALALGLALAAPAPVPSRSAALASAGPAHPRPLAALLLVADARSDPRLLRELQRLLQGLRFDVRVVDVSALAGAPQLALDVLGRAWRGLRAQAPGLPLALAGHGFGATLATVMADGLEVDERPQLLWLLAPGREVQVDAATPALDLQRPEAALARVDALCVGTLQRATQVLLVQGAQDGLVADDRARAIADAAPAATVYRVPAAGHHDLLARTEVREQLARLLMGWTVQARRAPGRRVG
ncbi:MAG: hypothetical protein U1F56_20230 [Rubrivivax sp.]